MENINVGFGILLPYEEPTASTWVSNIGKIPNSDILVLLPDEQSASNFPMDGWSKCKVEDYTKVVWPLILSS